MGNTMKNWAHRALLALGVAAAGAAPAAAVVQIPPTTGYYSITYDTDKATATLQVAGQIKVGQSSGTLSTAKVLIDGTTGSITVLGTITATSFSGDGSGLTGVSGGGGASTLAVATGTSSGFLKISSPTAIINFDSTQFSGQLTGGGTAYMTLRSSTVTLQGNVFNGASQLLQLTASGYLPNVPGVSTGVVTSAALSGNGMSPSPLSVVSSSVPILNASGFVQNFQIDSASVTKQGFVTLATLTGTAATATALAADPADADSGYVCRGINTTGVCQPALVEDASTNSSTNAVTSNALFDGLALKQGTDADLDDLADGSLTGSKVGDGVPAANIAAGSLDSDVIASSVAAVLVPATCGDATISCRLTFAADGRLRSVSSQTITGASETNTFGADASSKTLGGALLVKDQLITLGSATVAGLTAGAITNSTYDTAGTGNTLTAPSKITFRAGVCQNATASLGFGTYVSSGATAACVTGTNTSYGTANFVTTSTNSVQDHFTLPSDWTGNVDVDLMWRSTPTANNVVWKVRTICVADAETGDPAWNAQSTVTDATKGTTLQFNTASLTSITTTGCAASEEMFFEIIRDPAHASDTMDGQAALISATFTLRRAM